MVMNVWSIKEENKAEAFKVTTVINANTIMVTPDWQWNKSGGQILVGNTFRIVGNILTQNEKGNFLEVREKIVDLLLGKYILLRDIELISEQDNQISCNISLYEM
jgi:hypothetical protein